VTIPADATRIDATGKWVTPGLIDGAGQMGLVEISAVAATREAVFRSDRSPRRSTWWRGSTRHLR
jgi:imidazolonepropionase-like amidohydrolase